MFKNIDDFISLLEKKGELIRIGTYVNCDLEIAEITDRQAKSPDGGKALLFENTGTGFPVITNMMGSDRRISLALGVEDLSSLTKRIEDIFSSATSPKNTIIDKFKMLPLLAKMSKWMPKIESRHGICQQNIIKGDQVDLSILPILKCSPCDGGAFVTLPMVNTIDPDTGVRNVGMYRMQVFDNKTTGLHWHLHKTGERHYRAYKRIGKRMPVSVCLGGDPSYTYSATAPLPDGIDEYMLAGFIRGRAVKLVKSITNEIMVPTDCDIVIEGYVDPTEEKVIEGPFGDHTGFYSLEDLYPLFHVTAITYRNGAVYPATIVGIPPQEDTYIAKATEKIFLAPIRMLMQPEINDMYLPEEGVAHNIAFIDIDKSYPGQGFKCANSMWGAGQMMFNKFIIVTSSLSGKLSSLKVIKEILNRINIPNDLLFGTGPLDVLDHTANIMGVGGKLAFDATLKISGETTLRHNQCNVNVPEKITLSDGVVEVNDKLLLDGWGVLLIKVEHQTTDFRNVAQQFMRSNPYEGTKFIAIFDTNIDINDYKTLVWIAGNNCDAVRDTYIMDNIIVFDARAKYNGINGFSRRWPNVVTMDLATIEKVDKGWSNLGFDEFIPSPSIKYKNLTFSDTASVE